MQEIDKRAPDSLQAGRQTARAPAGRCKVVHLHLPGFCFSVFAEHHSCTMSDSEMPPSHLLQCEIRPPMLVFHCTSSLDTRQTCHSNLRTGGTDYIDREPVQQVHERGMNRRRINRMVQDQGGS